MIGRVVLTLVRLLVLALVLGLPFVAWGGSRFTPYADLTASATAQSVCGGANAARISCVCTNNDTAINVRFGDSVTVPTTTKGVRVGPGASISLGSTGANQVIAESGSPVVSCSEES